MTIYVIDALKNGISNELESYKRFELNLSQVEEIDSAGIQLLLAMKNELSRTNKQFKLTAVNGTVAQLLDIYNLTEHFGLGVAA